MVAVGLMMMGLVACTPAQLTSDATPLAPSTAAPTSDAPSPTEPDAEAIRSVDFGEMTWMWDSYGVLYEVELSGGAGQAPDPNFGDELGAFTLGEAVFSDANGDGLTDAALPLTWELGNGIAENWFIWLAQPEGSAPLQVPGVIASSARCGNASAVLSPIDGGFRVDEVVRSSIEMLGACAEGATLERSREIEVLGDGTGVGSWPATVDGAGWGGFCPVKIITEGEVAPAQGRVGPSTEAPETTATGDLLYTPINEYPFHEPDGWRLSAFITDTSQDSVTCVWIERTD